MESRDGDRHPYDELLLVPGTTFCSGALISEATILTAGHCRDGWDQLAVDEVLVSFEPQAEVDEHSMPVNPEEWYTASRWRTHPDYVEAEWPYTYDYGLVYLDDPVEGIEPAALPEEYQLQPIIDGNGQVEQRFTHVGYGFQGTLVGNGPPRTNVTWERKFAVARYAPGNCVTTGLFHETWFITSGPCRLPGTGGACGGDSGSPVLWGDTRHDRGGVRGRLPPWPGRRAVRSADEPDPPHRPALGQGLDHRQHSLGCVCCLGAVPGLGPGWRDRSRSADGDA